MASTGKTMLEMIRYRLAMSRDRQLGWVLLSCATLPLLFQISFPGVKSHSRLGPHLDRRTTEPDEASLITHSFSYCIQLKLNCCSVCVGDFYKGFLPIKSLVYNCFSVTQVASLMVLIRRRKSEFYKKHNMTCCKTRSNLVLSGSSRKSYVT